MTTTPCLHFRSFSFKGKVRIFKVKDILICVYLLSEEIKKSRKVTEQMSFKSKHSQKDKRPTC